MYNIRVYERNFRCIVIDILMIIQSSFLLSFVKIDMRCFEIEHTQNSGNPKANLYKKVITNFSFIQNIIIVEIF